MFEYGLLDWRYIHGTYIWFFEDVEYYSDGIGLVDMLNSLGSEGWELCIQRGEGGFIMKRAK